MRVRECVVWSVVVTNTGTLLCELENGGPGRRPAYEGTGRGTCRGLAAWSAASLYRLVYRYLLMSSVPCKGLTCHSRRRRVAESHTHHLGGVAVAAQPSWRSRRGVAVVA